MASIEGLNEYSEWRALFGGKSKRIRDHELIMRILALYTDHASYSRPLKTYLNKFARKERKTKMDVDPRGDLFLQACAAINEGVGPRAFRRPDGAQVNTAQAEALTVGVMEILKAGKDSTDLADRFDSLVNDRDFLKHTERATADKDAVDTRLARVRAFLS